MFWALRTEARRPRGSLRAVTGDIQTLNMGPLQGRLEVTAISIATYPFVQDRYILLPHGASIGSGYGPVVVAREHDARPAARGRDRRARDDDDAFLVLRLAARRESACGLPFDEIIDEVTSGAAARGCSSTRASSRTRTRASSSARPRRVVAARDGLPLPLGANVVRRDLGEETCGRSRRCCGRRSTPGSRTATRRSTTRSQFGAGSTPRADRFVGMYVNELTQDYGDEGREAVTELLRRAEASAPSRSRSSRLRRS